MTATVMDKIEAEFARKREQIEADYDTRLAALEARTEGWDPWEAGKLTGQAYHEKQDQLRLLREEERAALRQQAPEVLADIAAASAALAEKAQAALEELLAVSAAAQRLDALERRLHTAIGTPRPHVPEVEHLTWEIVGRRVLHLGTLGLGRPLPEADAPPRAVVAAVQQGERYSSFETPMNVLLATESPVALATPAAVLDTEEVA